ncbi:MAG: glycoside hydrolase family 88 protein [Verrucomicrobia bacterium]|nr:glycoside hydrolase family 88 protein [Verrucomicrobiota bacterium]
MIHLLLIGSGFMQAHADPLSQKSVLTLAEKSATWQLSKLPTRDWWTWPADHPYGQYWWSWWSWCDALYMAPPTFAKYAEATGQPRYLDKMDVLNHIPNTQ